MPYFSRCHSLSSIIRGCTRTHIRARALAQTHTLGQSEDQPTHNFCYVDTRGALSARKRAYWSCTPCMAACCEGEPAQLCSVFDPHQPDKRLRAEKFQISSAGEKQIAEQTLVWAVVCTHARHAQISPHTPSRVSRQPPAHGENHVFVNPF